MNDLDQKILAMLVDDGRMSFADIARELGISRVHARDRVQRLIDDGVIEKFTVIVNPEKVGTTVSAFFDVEVDPQGIEMVAEDLAKQTRGQKPLHHERHDQPAYSHADRGQHGA